MEILLTIHNNITKENHQCPLDDADNMYHPVMFRHHFPELSIVQASYGCDYVNKLWTPKQLADWNNPNPIGSGVDNFHILKLSTSTVEEYFQVPLNT